MQKSSIIRASIVGAVVVLLGALMIYNISNPSQSFSIWNESMTQGNKEEAKHHFIMYTDIFCPYCDKFSNAVSAHQDEFKKDYIDANNILFEIRITAMNASGGHSKNSQPAAEGAYCAGRQGKFWDYYHTILAKIYADYHSKGIGVDRDSERIPDLDMDYFYSTGKEAGLDEASFKSCLDNHETAKEVETNTARAAQITGGGVPFFQFDSNFAAPGFDGNWDTEHDWTNAKLMLDAGLSNNK